MAINWSLANCSCPLWNSSIDESALRRALDSLGNCSSLLHGWLRFWTLLVVIGVAFEIVFVVWEYIEDLHECKRSLLFPPVKPNLPLFLLGFLGAGLVTAGVAGELYIESKIATAETCIRKGNDELSLLLSKEAGDAKDSAIIANQAADRAKQEADIVAAQAEQLRKEVVALSPRTLSHEQQSKIAAALNRVPGSHPTIIESYAMDGEGTALASQLIAVFKAAKIPVGDWRADEIVSGGFEWGVSIRGPAHEMPFMTALGDALSVSGELKRVSINGPSAPIGAKLSGTAVLSGTARITAGGGPPVQGPIPTQGPVMVKVGIRPPTVLAEGGKPE